MKDYLLFVESNNVLQTEDVYDRLLSVVTPGIHSIHLLEDDILKNVIVVNSNMFEKQFIFEISELLHFVGYNGKFRIVKPIW
jgi:hypothetical protein